MPVIVQAATPHHHCWRAVRARVPAAAAFGFSSGNRSRCCRRIGSASARVGASVPRPHATSANPAALAHAARARCRRPAAQCPAPAPACVTTGATQVTHSSGPEGRVQSSASMNAARRDGALLSSPAIPALSPGRRVRAKLPGCRYPDVAAQRAQRGGDAQVRPHPRSHPAAHLLNRDLPAGLRGPCHRLPPVRKYPAPGTQARTLVIPSTTTSTWLVRRFRQLAEYIRRSAY